MERFTSCYQHIVRLTSFLVVLTFTASVAQAYRGAQGPYFEDTGAGGGYGGGYSSGGPEVFLQLILWVVGGWIIYKVCSEKGLSEGLSVHLGVFGGLWLPAMISWIFFS